MALTEQQACKTLQVTPVILNMYVATRRLSVTRKRTIRGMVVTYDERDVQALKRELEQDQDYIRQRLENAKSSSKTVEAEFVDAEAHSTNANGSHSFVPASAPVIERLLVLLDRLTPSDTPKAPIEKKLLLTLAEAVAYSGLSEVKLTETIRSGKLAARTDLGRGYKIKRSDLERYINSL